MSTFLIHLAYFVTVFESMQQIHSIELLVSYQLSTSSLAFYFCQAKNLSPSRVSRVFAIGMSEWQLYTAFSALGFSSHNRQRYQMYFIKYLERRGGKVLLNHSLALFFLLYNIMYNIYLNTGNKFRISHLFHSQDILNTIVYTFLYGRYSQCLIHVQTHNATLHSPTTPVSRSTGTW